MTLRTYAQAPDNVLVFDTGHIEEKIWGLFGIQNTSYSVHFRM